MARRLLHCEPREVTLDRRVQVDQSFVDQLESRHRGERLADRTDLEQRVGSNRPARGKIRESVRTDEKRAVAIGEAERQSRQSSALHLGPNSVVDGRRGCVIDHAVIVVLTAMTGLARLTAAGLGANRSCRGGAVEGRRPAACTSYSARIDREEGLHWAPKDRRQWPS